MIIGILLIVLVAASGIAGLVWLTRPIPIEEPDFNEIDLMMAVWHQALIDIHETNQQGKHTS